MGLLELAAVACVLDSRHELTSEEVHVDLATGEVAHGADAHDVAFPGLGDQCLGLPLLVERLGVVAGDEGHEDLLAHGDLDDLRDRVLAVHPVRQLIEEDVVDVNVERILACGVDGHDLRLVGAGEGERPLTVGTPAGPLDPGIGRGDREVHTNCHVLTPIGWVLHPYCRRG